MVISNNYTDHTFAIQNDAERYFWIVFHVIIIMSSLFGDSLILFASFQKDAFKLNSFIVVAIQYIAVFDLAQSIFGVIPKIPSLIANSRVLSDALCSVQDIMIIFLATAMTWLTPVLTTSKLLLIKHPLRSASLTNTKRAHMVCLLALIPSVIVTATKLIVDDDISFDFRAYTCAYIHTADIWKTLVPIFTVIALFLPNLILIATTIPTLKHLYTASKSARRVKGSIPWQGAVTVSLTATIYCISYLPSSIYYAGAVFIKSRFFHVHIFRAANFLAAISIMSNIYIYTLTVRSFRRFVFSRILALDRFNVISNSAERGHTSGKSLIVHFNFMISMIFFLA